MAKNLPRKEFEILSTIAKLNRKLSLTELYSVVEKSKSQISESEIYGTLCSLRNKKLINWTNESMKKYKVLKAGIEFINDDSSERRLVHILRNNNDRLPIKKLEELWGHSSDDLKFGIAHALENHWINIFKDKNKNIINLLQKGKDDINRKDPLKLALIELRNKEGLPNNLDFKKERILKQLINRNLVSQFENKRIYLELSTYGEQILDGPITEVEEISIIPATIIKHGLSDNQVYKTYDINGIVNRLEIGKLNNKTLFIKRLRDIYLDLGFCEISHRIVTSSFWNFDILNVPKDHSHRNTDKIIYLKDPATSQIDCDDEIIDAIKLNHKKMYEGETLSQGMVWDKYDAMRLMLSSHTTSTMMKYLVNNHDRSLNKIFIIGNVFRKEQKVRGSRIKCFHQIEGAIVDDNVSLSDLITIIKLIFQQLNLENHPDIIFCPGDYPYTIPSVNIYLSEKDEYGSLNRKFIGAGGVFDANVLDAIGFTSKAVGWGLLIDNFLPRRSGED